MSVRSAKKLMIQSGLADLLGRYNLDTFETEAPYQKAIKEAAIQYTEGKGGLWFFIGGQVGCGKTHICTAISQKLMEDGVPVRYMLWQDESKIIKGCINDSEAYESRITELKRVPVLYIDDLFKTERSDGKMARPTTADINLAFEIINARYNDRSLKTIISCEWLLSELIEFDEGTVSRIYERSRGSRLEISRDPAKNYRLR